jgi:chromosome segregation ATPase
MKGKKGKALADKLIDDLLDDESIQGTGSYNSPESSQPFYLKDNEPEKPDAIEERTINLEKNAASQPPPVATVVATNRFVRPTAQDSQVSKDFAKKPTTQREYSAQNPHEASLVQSENMRVAQQRILDLEEEISRLRTENEELAAAADTLRKLVEDLKGQVERLQKKLLDSSDSYKAEKELLLNTATAKDKAASELKQKVSELETRLTANIHKIRNRERELENRLELVKIESQALVRSKDELTLELKRQIDQLRNEIENYRNKSQELKKRSDDKQEILRRTVKTLRLALTMLEGEEDGSDGNNKAS